MMGKTLPKKIKKCLTKVQASGIIKSSSEESALLIKQKAVAWRRGHDTNRSGFLTYLMGDDRKG
jgi:hypothetical protein